MAIGFTLPFTRSTGSIGYLESTNDQIEATRQNIKSLLVTNWGERPMHFRMGCNLPEFFFENVRPKDIRQKVEERVHSQIGMWLPFVTVEEVLVFFHEDDRSIDEHAIRFRIKFRISSKPDFSAILDFTTPPLVRD